ncbi:MAG: oligosaccharide flippase family protein [candidate division KSB1 bacterium]|nr:oligosaccharide flippase family protein [candidate division KSB1 bacterium]
MSKLSKNIIYNLLGHVLLLILGFVAVKNIFQALGEDALGIIFFTTLLNTIIRTVMQRGISSTIVREVSAHYLNNSQYIKRLVQTFTLLHWAVFLLLSMALYLIAPVLVHKWIHLKTMTPAAAIEILRMLGVASLVALPVSFYASLLNGIQRMGHSNSIDVFTTAWQQFSAVVVLHFGGNLFQVVYCLVAGYALRVILYWSACVRFFKIASMIPRYSFEVLKTSWQFMSRMIFISVITPLRTQLDKVIISKILPIGILGYYSVAYTNISRGQLLTRSISAAAYPSFAELFQAKNYTAMEQQYHRLQDLICLLIMPVFAGIAFVAQPLFSYVLNREAAAMLQWPIIFLCLGFYLNGTLNIPHVVALAMGKPGILARQSLYSFLVVIPLSVPIIYYGGLIGAGLAWVLDHLFLYTYFVPRFCRECLHSPSGAWFKHVGRILMLALLSYGIMGLMLVATRSNSLFALLLGYGVGTILFLAGAWLIMSAELKEVIMERSRLVFAKLGLVGSVS